MVANKRKSCAEHLNCVAAWWFWVTIIGVFYLGIVHILPVLYENEVLILAHHIWIFFMFIQMMINWLCVKLIKSPFRAEDHKHLTDPEDAMYAAKGFEINLNYIKNENATSFKVPLRTIQQTNGHSKAKLSDTMYLIAVPTPEEMHESDRRLVFPYWTWKPCLVCQIQRPPRTHHCPLCNVCVLKRDHHCFFSNSCIGLRNQRHFIVFNFWASLGTMYCVIHSTWYMFAYFVPRNTLWDIILPITVGRWGFGRISNLDTIMVTMLYSVTWFALTSLGFLLEQAKIIQHGTTSFEEDNNIKIINTNSIEDNIRGVFGEHWLLNFILPLHLIYPNRDDGVHWRNVKV